MKLGCHPERSANAGERESKDPGSARFLAPSQGILTKGLGGKLTSIFFVVALISALHAGGPTSYVTTTPTSPIKIPAGRTATAEFRFRVTDGYHINSSKPKSDLLIPTELKLDPDPAFMVKDLQYPPGKELTLSFDPTHPLSVYSGDFIVHAQLAVSRAASPGRYELTGELRYQACSDRACYPPKKLPVNLEVDVLPEK